jgi:hypothetical protein
MNLSKLPRQVIEAIDQSLKQGKAVVGMALSSVMVSAGDALRGAGLLAIYRAWYKYKLRRLLSGLTPAEQQSVLAMVAGRILAPCSKLALQTQLADTWRSAKPSPAAGPGLLPDPAGRGRALPGDGPTP